jgi:hypothetical protein
LVVFRRIEGVSGNGSRRALRRNGQKGIRLGKEDFMCVAVTVRLINPLPGSD